MKVQVLAKVATNPEVERLIIKSNEGLQGKSRKNGTHYASKNQPAPKGDKLGPYIKDIKAGYEQLATEVHKYIQPGTHLPEGQLEADRTKEKSKKLEEQIFQLEEQNRRDEFELQNHDSKSTFNRIFIALLITAFILVGEVLFNAKAFEISGENMLFALIISFSISFAVYVFSHVIPDRYRKIETPRERRIFILSVLGIVTLVFTALAVLRSYMLALHRVAVSPVVFVIINLFLFIASVLFSAYLFPAWEEIKGSFHNMRLHKAIKNRIKEIEVLQKELEELKKYITELAQQIIRISYYTENTNKRIEKMYHEAVGIFISVNIATRTDRMVPDCFNEELPTGDFKH